ncbi:hypothetical protein ACFXKS_30450 [Streptomyces scopuliridis]|uniref:hypothetical protein n=1 Tax=Streptomyces scopuliridis TaxID=452529 RepID=UPI0036969E12
MTVTVNVAGFGLCGFGAGAAPALLSKLRTGPNWTSIGLAQDALFGSVSGATRPWPSSPGLGSPGSCSPQVVRDHAPTGDCTGTRILRADAQFYDAGVIAACRRARANPP